MEPELVLAPLRGVTDAAFRSAFTRHFGGFDWAIAPFVSSAKGKQLPRSHFRDFEPVRNSQIRIVPQVLSNDPAELLSTIEALSQMGYREVNWNLGCPFIKVTRKRRGSGLLPYPEKILAILEHVCPRIHVSLSLKVRLGLTGPTELERLLPSLDSFPLASITIHPRTAVQMYDGPLKLEYFARCLELTRHRIFYNGDITSVNTWYELREQFGNRVAGWMIGRGAITDPFLPTMIRGAPPPIRAERCQRVASFHEELLRLNTERMPGSAALLAHMKELWRLLAHAVPNGPRYLGAILRCQSLNKYASLTTLALSPE